MGAGQGPEGSTYFFESCRDFFLLPSRGDGLEHRSQGTGWRLVAHSRPGPRGVLVIWNKVGTISISRSICLSESLKSNEYCVQIIHRKKLKICKHDINSRLKNANGGQERAEEAFPGCLWAYTSGTFFFPQTGPPYAVQRGPMNLLYPSASAS